MDEDGEIMSIWGQAPDRPPVVAIVDSSGKIIRSSRGFSEPKPAPELEKIIQPSREFSEPKSEPEPKEVTLRQKLDNGKAQRLREKWLSQWIVQNRNIDQYAVYQQRQRLEMLSTKDILNIEKELNRQARLYASRRAAYNRRVREANRPKPYYYWYASPRGFRWYYGYYRGCY
jgi:hypothetical protein